MRRIQTFTVGIAASLLLSTSVFAELTHRYTFDTDASDSVGTAHGTLQGGAFVSEGGVVLDAATESFVELPGGLITGSTAVTIESWASFGDNANWVRLYDFGDINTELNAGRDYIMFTPHSNANDARMSIADGDPGNTHEQTAASPGVLDNQGVVHVVAVYDPTNFSLRLYLNGVLAAYRTGEDTIPLANINNVFSYIGKSLYPDPYVNATVNEFRIYNHAFSAYEVATSFADGPETYTPRTTPAPTAVTLTLTPTILVNGTVNPVLRGTFGGLADLDVSGEPGITFLSSDPSIVTTNAAGQLEALAVGTAQVTASFMGFESTASVEVQPIPVPAASLAHRYSFNEESSSVVVEDLVGDADATLVQNAVLTGTGQVDLTAVGDPFADGYVDLPNGIISALNNATFEAWATFDAAAGNWQRMFDFGNNTSGEELQGTGTSYIFFSPRGGGDGPFRFAVKDEDQPEVFVDGPFTLPAGVETHVVATYNVEGNVAKVYLNGELLASGTAPYPLSSIDDVNNWLGRSNYPDAGFDGQFNEFRIYEGVLTDLQVAVSEAAGPNNVILDPGALQSLTAEVSSTTLPITGLPGTLRVIAEFAQIQEVDITGVEGVRITSSNSDVVSVSADGTLTPEAVGNADITVQYGGQETSVSVTVNEPQGTLQLLHRYSFNEAPGALIVDDSVGNADGNVIGNATFTGDGRLTLPGGPADTVDAGYVDLPNGMISALPEAVTIESWVTWNGGGDWQRIFDFGNNLSGEDLQGTGDSTFILTPQAGGVGVVRAAFRPDAASPEVPTLDGPTALATGAESHVAVVYDYTSRVARLYVNGERVDTAPVEDPLSVLNDINNWLGRSNWPDSYFNGLFNEFRIWSGAMNDTQVATRFAAGPDSLEGPVDGPELTFAKVEEGLAISWPATATGYELQQTTALGPDVTWTAATEQQPVTSGGVTTVTVEPSGTARFFRLSQ